MGEYIVVGKNGILLGIYEDKIMADVKQNSCPDSRVYSIGETIELDGGFDAGYQAGYEDGRNEY